MPARPPTANATGFDEHFEQARTTIFRLETLQNYGNSGEDPALAAFLAGQPHLITPAKREWTALVRDRRAAGCAMQRVHVVTEPITDYLRFELTWGYQPNVDAGEDIRIVPVAVGQQWPPELPVRTDFWLFDLSVLFALRYNQGGAWLATDEVTDPAAVEQACVWREAALQRALPWRHYIDAHPQLFESLPRQFRAS
jgi:hypothetical protein